MKYISTDKDLDIDKITPEFLNNLGWHELHKIADKLVNKISKKALMDKILEIYPLKENEQYVGSLANHYRGRLKHEGAESLIEQMCSNSIRRLIIGLS